MTALAIPKPKARLFSPPSPRRWTTREFQRLSDSGWFDGSRAILIDGEILTMPMADPPHNTTLGKTERWLNRVFHTGCHVRNQMALDVGTLNDLGPDLAVVEGDWDDYAKRQVNAALLIVEIADSSFETDTKVKSHLYAQAGINDYWVVDVNGRTVVVFRDPIPDQDAPRGFRYRSVQTFKSGDSISPLTRPDSTTLVSSLLPVESC